MALTNAERQRRFIDRLKARAAASLLVTGDQPAPAARKQATRKQATRIKQLEAENDRLRAEVDRLESDRRYIALRRERDALAEQLAAIKAYAPGILAEAREWTGKH